MGNTDCITGSRIFNAQMAIGICLSYIAQLVDVFNSHYTVVERYPVSNQQRGYKGGVNESSKAFALGVTACVYTDEQCLS